MVLTWAPDRTLLNLNASVSRGSWALEIFARNVLDSDYVASATYNLTGNRNVRYEGVLGERRTWGATIRFRHVSEAINPEPATAGGARSGQSRARRHWRRTAASTRPGG